MSQKFIDRARGIISEHMSEEKFGVRELAAALGLSSSQTLKKIKAATGKSVNQFIRELRLEKAANLIKQTDLNIAEISYQVGFSSHSYFTKVFIKYYGIAPSDYKNQSRTSVSHKKWSDAVSVKKVKYGFITALALLMIFVLISNFTIANSGFSNSIAVLPFKDLSPDKDQEYFADGLSRSIYDRLVQYKKLKVISPTSSFTFKNKNVGVNKIGEELGIQYVLDGSVLKSGEMFRVNVNLVDTKDGSAIWSKTYDEKAENLLFTYDKIAEKVGEYLKLTIDYTDVRLRKVDPEAYDLYLKAETDIDLFIDSTITTAENYINRSLDIDPTYAPAWSTKSNVINFKSYWRTNLKVDGEEQEGIKAAKRAIELDPDLFSGYLWLSRFQWRARDMVGFEENFTKVLELAPNNAEALLYAAQCAMRTNKLEEARELLKKAKLLDPANALVHFYAGFVELYFENYDEALSNFIIRRDLAFGLHVDDYMVALVYYYKGQPEKALEELEKEDFEYYKFLLKSIIYYDMGNLEESNRNLERLKNKDFSTEGWMLYSDAGTYSDIAQIYAIRGDKDNAFKYLDKSVEWIYHFPEVFFIHTSYKKLYDDPRWDQLLDKIGREFNYNFKNKP